MPLTAEQFVQRLTSSGLLSEREVHDCLATIPAEQRPSDGAALARVLIEQKKLTSFQVQQIEAGNEKSLTLGNYVVTDKLGQGGMGMVLKAIHRRMERVVAIKVMSPQGMQSSDAVQRFHREVKAAAKLSHPNIVAAHDADEANGTHFLVMEYVEGSDLSALVKKQGPLSTEQAVRCILQAARGLEFAHKRGVVHRDIKPANLLLDHEGTVKILDMGLARIEDSVGGSSEGAGLTSTGTIMGTVDYMSPEQAMDTKSADARSDIYSLGCSLFYLLTGRCLYDGDTLMKKLMAHQSSPVPSLTKEFLRGGGLIEVDEPTSTAVGRAHGPDSLSERVDTVFRQMVAKSPQDRPQSATEVIALLERCLSGGDATLSSGWPVGRSAGGSDSTTGKVLHGGPRPIGGEAGSTATQVASAGVTASDVTLSSVADATLIASPGDVAADPRGGQTVLSDHGGGLGPSGSRATPGSTSTTPTIRRMRWLVGSIAVAAATLLAILFGPSRPSGTPDDQSPGPKELAKEPTSPSALNPPGQTTNLRTPPNGPPSSTSLTPYEILISPDYEWTTPENLGPDVNTGAAEAYPALFGHGLRLAFHSFGRAGNGLSEATRTGIDQPFRFTKPLGEEFSHSTAGFGTALSDDGLVLVFGSNRPGGPGDPGNPNIWQATRPDLSTPFSQPVCLTTLSSSAADVHPCLSPDGLTIWFNSNRPGRLRGETWMSRRASREAEFDPPVPVELALIPGLEHYSHFSGVAVSSDERVLIFAPFYHFEGQGVQTLLMCTRPTRDAKFGTPVDLGPALGGANFDLTPTLSADGSVLIFQSGRPGSVGSAPDSDLWMTRRVRKVP